MSSPTHSSRAGSSRAGSSRAGGRYTLASLLEDAASRRLRLRGSKDEKLQLYGEVWRAMNDWLLTLFDKGKGGQIPGLGRVSWEVIRSKTTGAAQRVQPIFLADPRFLRQYGLRFKKPLVSPAFVGCEMLNLSKVAIKFSRGLRKEQVMLALRDLLQVLGAVMSSGVRVAVRLYVGTLVAKERRIGMQFDPALKQMVLRKHGATVLAAMRQTSEELRSVLPPASAGRASAAASSGAGAGGAGAAAARPASSSSSKADLWVRPPTPADALLDARGDAADDVHGDVYGSGGAGEDAGMPADGQAPTPRTLSSPSSLRRAVTAAASSRRQRRPPSLASRADFVATPLSSRGGRPLTGSDSLPALPMSPSAASELSRRSLLSRASSRPSLRSRASSRRSHASSRPMTGLPHSPARSTLSERTLMAKEAVMEASFIRALKKEEAALHAELRATKDMHDTLLTRERRELSKREEAASKRRELQRYIKEQMALQAKRREDELSDRRGGLTTVLLPESDLEERRARQAKRALRDLEEQIRAKRRAKELSVRTAREEERRFISHVQSRHAAARQMAEMQRQQAVRELHDSWHRDRLLRERLKRKKDELERRVVGGHPSEDLLTEPLFDPRDLQGFGARH